MPRQGVILACAGLILGFFPALTPPLLWAADTTPPTTPVVTDDGTIAPAPTELHATWTASSDPESGLVQYEYLIRQDSVTGPILVNWTSVGLSTGVTRTGLTLINGVLYYIGVRARNGARLYSSVSYSDGIQASRPPDSTQPTAPGQPTEGSSQTDYDYDSAGNYYVYWPAASDSDSGISAYELQERVGSSGAWTLIATTSASVRYAWVSGRLDQTAYTYQVRARNGFGTWGNFSPVSDGILIDRTAPATVTVTDDGATTPSMSTLHAAWTPSNDPESGVVDYQYLIRQDSIAGPIVVNYTSVGTATETTKTGLSLIIGKTYYLGVRAKNGAGLYSSLRYSNGIMVSDALPPPRMVSINDGAAATQTTTVTLTFSAADNSGTVSQLRCSNDNVTYTEPEPYAATLPWTLMSGDGVKTVYVKFADPAGNWSEPVSDTIVLDTVSPTIKTVYPQASPSLYAGNTLTIVVSVTDTDPSPLECQFSIDGMVKQAWSAAATYPWVTTSAMAGSHSITVEVRDAGGAVSKTQTLYLYLKPPGPP